MKHLKYFEYDIKYNFEIICWAIKTKMKDLEVSLDKIGLNKKDSQYSDIIIKIKELKKINKNDYVFIECLKTDNFKIWSCSITKPKSITEYKGKVEITETDIENYKLKTDSEKYNL